jgi:peptidoglycan hydrolase CwlO-like protein
MKFASYRRVITFPAAVLIIAGMSFTNTKGQELIKDSAKPVTASEPNVNERVRVLENELERQNAKLDQLQKTIAEQQATLAALIEKLWLAKLTINQSH